jgi:SAM-dependent methyltransferase
VPISGYQQLRRPGKAVARFRKYAADVYIRGKQDCDSLGEEFLVAGPPGTVLLDIGCAEGDLSLRWARAARATQVIGLDFVESELNKARAKGIDGRKADLNETWPVADEECDIVVSSQNIEHMHRTMFYLSEVKRVLKPGGRAVILTENLASWPNVAALTLGLQPFSTIPFEGQYLGNPFAVHIDECYAHEDLAEAARLGVVGVHGHVKVFAYRGFRDAIEKAGMEVSTYRTSGYAPFLGKPSQWLSRVDPRHAHFLAIEAVKPRVPSADASRNGAAQPESAKQESRTQD